jgi:HlyD family secretion protein
LASAQAEVLQARARLSDLTKGRRPEEINIILKQKEQAEASLENAEKEYRRVRPLVHSGAASQAMLDQRKAAYEADQARVDELSAQLKVATLGAREDEINAAQAAVELAEQRVIQAERLLQESAPKAAFSGRIEDVFYRPGEFVAEGSPVVSLLPPENVKVRFFVSQAKLPGLTLGSAVNIECDGCAEPVHAKVTFISSQAEFTPPVIYSVESRDKLVFMLEATPDAYHASLHPGLPVDIVPVRP